MRTISRVLCFGARCDDETCGSYIVDAVNGEQCDDGNPAVAGGCGATWPSQCVLDGDTGANAIAVTTTSVHLGSTTPAADDCDVPNCGEIDSLGAPVSATRHHDGFPEYSKWSARCRACA
ncbi:MAG: hypothetical protein ABI333_26245 [bacterium]